MNAPQVGLSHRRRSTAVDLVASASLLIGTCAAIALAAVLEAARSSYGETNVAITLAFVVVATASWGDRATGLFVGAVTGLAFNFFHTQPLHSLRIADVRDVLTVAQFPALGLLAGWLATRRVELAESADTRRAMLRHLQLVSSLTAAGAGLDATWPAARDALADVLRLRSVRFEAATSEPSATFALPTIDEAGAIRGTRLRSLGTGLALPAEGVTIPVLRRGERLGSLVLLPLADLPTSVEQRRTGVVIAQLLAQSFPSDPVLSLD